MVLSELGSHYGTCVSCECEKINKMLASDLDANICRRTQWHTRMIVWFKCAYTWVLVIRPVFHASSKKGETPRLLVYKSPITGIQARGLIMTCVFLARGRWAQFRTKRVSNSPSSSCRLRSASWDSRLYETTTLAPQPSLLIPTPHKYQPRSRARSVSSASSESVMIGSVMIVGQFMHLPVVRMTA